MCPESSHPDKPESALAWLELAIPVLPDDHPGGLRRVDTLLCVVVSDPAAFSRLPAFAAPIVDTVLTTPRPAAHDAHGCCCGHSPARIPDGEAPPIPWMYIDDSPTRRWVRMMVPPGTYARATAEVFAALSGYLLAFYPVYRRGDAFMAVHMHEVVARVPADGGGALVRMAQETGLSLTRTGSRTVLLRANRPLNLTAVAAMAKRYLLRDIQYQCVQMRASHTLGSPVWSRRSAPLGRVMPVRSGRPGAGLPLQSAQDGNDAPVDWPALWHLRAIQAEEDRTGLTAVSVGVIDSKFIPTDHEDLAEAVAVPIEIDDYDPAVNIVALDPTRPRPVENHGMACTGVVVASQVYKTPKGVAPHASVKPIYLISWTLQGLAQGIRKACAEGVRVLSLSLGWFEDDPGLTSIGIDAVEAALHHAYLQDVLVVVSSGNVLTANITDRKIGFPSLSAFAMAVGAVACPPDQIPDTDSATAFATVLRAKSFADGSQEEWAARFLEAQPPGRGREVGRLSVVAPGSGIWTTDTTQDKVAETFNGTSAATPQVAGLAALLFGMYPDLTAAQVRYVIEATATKVSDGPTAGGADGTYYAWHSPWDSSTRAPQLGYGCIHVQRALTFADVYLHDATRDRTPLAPVGARHWRSNDVTIKRIGNQLKVTVTVHNAGPAIADGVTAKVWLLVDSIDEGQPLMGPWQLDGQLSLTGVEAISLSLSPPADTTLKPGESRPLYFSTSISGVPTTKQFAYLLVAVDADNDHAFKSTLPALPHPIQPHNNLARVSLAGVLD